ncbi:bromodomain-containing protein 7 isoform X2 [Aphidius gifuensis]|nr:bromodomain-containing protein 7 isoform X2 [Aphidius gifuensis]
MLSHQYQQLGMNYSVSQGDNEYDKYITAHKKLKKKKKKKDKRHKHHHKDKKRRRDESSQESVGDPDDNIGITETPAKKKTLHSHHHNHHHHQQQHLNNNNSNNINNNSSNNQQQQQQQQHQIHNLNVPKLSSQLNVGSQQIRQSVSPHREPRTCVLKKIAERTPLQRLLEYLLRSLEIRDPEQFFAWPVTDSIAPGYSEIIRYPMDFSTMKQKIIDNNYTTLNEFISDFKLMCDNAMTYNHQETIYYKAAKKLLHVGLKMVTADKLRQLRSVLTYMRDISCDELGFELGVEDPNNPDVLTTEEQIEREREQEERNEEAEELRKENQRKIRLANLGKFEAIPDDLTPDEILKQARNAAKIASDKLSMKRINSKMGFLRQKKDGTTSLQIIVNGNNGEIPGTNQRPVSLGQLIGKLSHGTGALAGFREDRRNMSKPVKPLYYGAFGSYAPSYDSTFANLTKDETELVYSTYGDDTAVQYAESILDFAKDCDYTLTMVDDLLDILTNGDHRKTKKILDEKRKLKEEEEKIKNLLEKPTADINRNNSSTTTTTTTTIDTVKVDVNQLKSLAEFGIDINFLDGFEQDGKIQEDKSSIQNRLDDTSQMLVRLKQAQHDRLSAPPPSHLSNVPKATDNEILLAEKITDNLTEVAKKLPPSAIASVDGLRRAMGIAPVGGPEPMEVEPITHNPTIVIENNNTTTVVQTQISTNLHINNTNNNQTNTTIINQTPIQIQIGNVATNSVPALLTNESSGVPDLESELREFLESDPTLGHSPLHDDKTLEDILSES